MSKDRPNLEKLKYSLVKSSEAKLDRKFDEITKYYSAPNTPQKSDQPISLGRAISVSDLSKKFEVKMSLKDEFAALRKKRAPHRAQVTKNLKQMKDKLDDKSLSISSIKEI